MGVFRPDPIFLSHPDFEFVQQAVAQIPWGHTVRLMELVKDAKQRE